MLTTHLRTRLQDKLSAEAGICCGHVSNVQLAQLAALAENVLSVDIFEQSGLVGILPQLQLHQAVVKAIHLVPEGQPCCTLPCRCHVQ